MYNQLIHALSGRDEPIQVAIAGCGWDGAGVARELSRLPGFHVQALIDKDQKRIHRVFSDIHSSPDLYALVWNASELRRAQQCGKAVAFSEIAMIAELENVDVVFEAIGEVAPGLEVAQAALQSGKHLVTANCEMDATVGLMLSLQAAEKGLIYSEADGDQPAVLARVIAEVRFMGFQPRIVGNCKGFLDYYQTPVGVLPFVPPGQNPVQLCANADGSKQSIEMTILGNAFGYRPYRRGMFGPRTTKRDLIRDFGQRMDLNGLTTPVVDYVMGIDGVDQGGGVFVVARRSDEPARSDLRYLKKGEGPYYLFFRDHHLCYFESAASIAEAVLFHSAALAPKGRYMEVITMAKRDIEPGHRLDGIGGFDCYGLAERADTAEGEQCLCQGLAEFATARTRIPRDTPITLDMVDLCEEPAVLLKHRQDQLPLETDVRDI